MDETGQHRCPRCLDPLKLTEGGCEYCPQLHYSWGSFPVPTWSQVIREKGHEYGDPWEIQRRLAAQRQDVRHTAWRWLKRSKRDELGIPVEES